jgi:hypothetical protein
MGGLVSAVEDLQDPDVLVVRASYYDVLKDMADHIELAGNAEGVAHKLGPIHSTDVEGYSWAVEVPRATWALWLEFEALNSVTYSSEQWLPVKPQEAL